MQRYFIVFSYTKPDKSIAVEETWCKDPKEALGRVRVKLKPFCDLRQAFFVEWQNPDAPLEPLNAAAQMHKSLDPGVMEAVMRQRKSKTEAVLDKIIGKTKPRIKLKHKDPPPVPKAQPFRLFDVFPAIAWRDMHWSNGDE